MKQFRRDITVSAPAFIEDADNRIVELAFSSECPYPRMYTDQNGDEVELKEILVHDKETVDLSVLNDNASLLFNHEFNQHIGKVIPGSARVDSDRVARCHVQFSKVGQLANETYEKVKEGTLGKVSVGYTVLDGYADFEKGAYYVTKFQPYEVSIVSVPADSSVGVGRSLNNIVIDSIDEEQTVTVKTKKEMFEEEDRDLDIIELDEERQEDEEERDVDNEEERYEDGEDYSDSESDLHDRSAAGEEEVDEEREHEEDDEPFERDQDDIDEIKAIGKRLNIDEEIIEDAINDESETVESFKQRAMKIYKKSNSKTFTKGKTQMTDTIKTLERRFDLNAAMRQLANEKPLKGAEAEYSQEMARQAARRGRAQRYNSVFVPASALRSGQPVKTTTVEPMVGTDIRQDSFVDLLLEKSILGDLGINTLTGLTAPVSVPRMTKNATENFGFVTEHGEGVMGELKFDGVPMSMKTFTGAVAMSRQSMISMPNIGALAAEHLLKASRIKLEQLILGNSEVTNASNGLTKQLIDAGKVIKCDLSYKNFITEIAKLTDAGVDEAAIKLAMRGALAADLASTLRDQNVHGYILEDGKIANRPVHTSGVLAEGAILAGDFSALCLGEWAGLEIDVDLTSLRSKGATVLRIWADLDWCVTNPDAIRVIQKSE